MRRAGDSGVRRAVLGLLVVGLVVAGWWMSGRGAVRVDAPAPVVGDGPASPPSGGAQHRGNAAAIEAAAPLERRRVPVPGVRGRLCDHRGEPVPFCELALAAIDGAWSKTVALDQDGRFAFPSAPAGELSLTTVPKIDFAMSLTLAEGEGIELDLRLPEDLVATHGTFELGGSRQRRALVRVHVDGRACAVPRGSDDRHHAVLPAGEVRFELVRHLSELAACSHRVTLPVGQGQLQWTAALRCQDLRVEVEGPVGKADIRLRRLDGTYTQERRSLHGRTATLPLVPPGEYELSVTGRYVADQPPKRVRMLAQAGVQTAVVAISRVASVRLLFESAGHVHALDADNTPVLISAAGRDGERQHRWQTWGNARFGEYGFLDVPPGPARVVARDRIVDGAWRYLAFDPVPDLRVVVLPNRESVAALQVEARAHVDLRACSRSGMEQFGATIEVFAGGVPVHSRGERCSHFAGHLPVGDYRVVVDRGGSRSETGLQVGRRDVRLRLRP